jgi:hypothetical protein
MRRARFVPLPERQAAYDELVRYVPLELAARYAADGWAVRRLTCHHGRRSALASRWVAKGGSSAETP